MTETELMEAALLAYAQRDFQRADEADEFFGVYGVGNTVEFPVAPDLRFRYYRELLARMLRSDQSKFIRMHKGTPLYFLAWLAFDLHQFESALHYLDAAIAEDQRKDPSGWFDNPGAQFLMLNAPVQAARRTVEILAARLDAELQRFEARFGLSLKRKDFLDRFAEPILRAGTIP